MERVGRGAAVRWRIDEGWNRGQHFPERSGIAMRHDERQGRCVSRLLMDEVDLVSIDRRRVVVEAIEGGFLRAPVVLVFPVGSQLLKVGSIGSHRPRGAGG